MAHPSRLVLLPALALIGFGHAGARTTAAKPEIIATFSIAAADPDKGECGAAVASMYPAVGKEVVHARAGVGVFCTQHYSVKKWGERALDLLAGGKLPEDVLAELLRDDAGRDGRQ